MKTHVIYWFNPLERHNDWEEFESLEQAETALAEYVREYPWNTYTLAAEVKVIEATEKWKGPYSTAPEVTGLEGGTGATATAVLEITTPGEAYKGKPFGYPPLGEGA